MFVLNKLEQNHLKLQSLQYIKMETFIFDISLSIEGERKLIVNLNSLEVYDFSF